MSAFCLRADGVDEFAGAALEGVGGGEDREGRRVAGTVVELARAGFLLRRGRSLAGATGSRLALTSWSSSANINSRHASRMCHSTY
jgi:hypothetical protein